MKLSDIDVRLLRLAVRVYLEHAYPSGSVPPSIDERLRSWGDSPREILLSDAFEKEEASTPLPGPGRFALRLGSVRYPHMKLVIERCADCEDFFFAVDTHDRHFLDNSMPVDKKARWVALQEYNRLLKASIESAWEGCGIPTFCSYTLARMGRGKVAGNVHGTGPAGGNEGGAQEA